MNKYFAIILVGIIPILSYGQTDSGKLNFKSDFRFRAEGDWGSRKANGTYRDDRTRARLRFRLETTYIYNKWVSFGARMHAGNLQDQQNSLFTLGTEGGEFSMLSLGLDKAYIKFKRKGLESWLGKNTFPFEKHHELFWSDNVTPEGAALSYKLTCAKKALESLKLNTGFFISRASGQNYWDDAYLAAAQLVSEHIDKQLQLSAAWYFFNNMANIPDGAGTYTLDYSILHAGTLITVGSHPFAVGLDYYHNISDLAANDSIPAFLADQKAGLVMLARAGELKNKKDWMIQTTLTYLEKYAAVDYFAQNDWARWDYSGYGSPAARLTNMKGLEVSAGYAFGPNLNLVARAFFVEQIVPEAAVTETNTRVRLDLNIGMK